MIVLAQGVVVPEAEILFKATAAGGPGGQHVNKVATRVELYLDIAHSPSIAPPVKHRLLATLAASLDSEGTLRVVASSERSQSKNREAALERLKALLTEALRPRKKRIRTKPTKASKRRRLDDKRHRAQLKNERSGP